MICVVSTPEVVARVHAQAQVEAVILHTFFFDFLQVEINRTDQWVGMYVGCMIAFAMA
jgi:hypothetical protein